MQSIEKHLETRFRFFTMLLIIIVFISSCGADHELTEKEYTAAGKLYLQGDTQEALARYRTIIARDPDFANAHIMAGKIFYYKRKFETAEKYFNDALAIDQGNLNALLWLAKTQSFHTTRHNAALKNLSRLLAMDSSHTEAWYLRGSILEARGKLPQAMTSYRRSIRVERRLALVHARIAGIYLRAGLKKKSRDELRLASVLARNDPMLRKRVQSLLTTRGVPE